MAIPYNYNYYDGISFSNVIKEWMGNVYGPDSYKYYWAWSNISKNSECFPREEYFEDTDKTVIRCCKDLVSNVNSYVDSINYAIDIGNKYLSAIISGEYKMSKYDFYNEEIKKGLLTYITNVYRNYPVFSNKALDKKMLEMLLQMIRNGYYPKVKVKKFDKYIEYANECNSAQDIAELIEFRHTHYGNNVSESRFNV